MTCVGALLVRDEAGPDRYLARVLANAASFVDEIVVLDDGSTDDTIKVCQVNNKVSVVESTRSIDGWWGGAVESHARRALWELACQHASPQGWVYVFDADHELVGIEPTQFRELLRTTHVDAWACPLWDCWDSDSTHRVDGFWQAWRSPRVWLARALPGTWSGRGVHAGHLPLRDWTAGLMPPGTAIRHLGYIKEEHRLRKAERYLNLQHA